MLSLSLSLLSLLQGGTIKFIVDYLHIDRSKNAKKSLCEEINSKLFEHIMTGIEVSNKPALAPELCESLSDRFCLIRSSLASMDSSMQETDSIIMIRRCFFYLSD